MHINNQAVKVKRTAGKLSEDTYTFGWQKIKE